MTTSVSSGARGTHASMQYPQININLPHRQPKPINREEFIRNVNIELYNELDNERQEEFLEDIDAIELFDTITELDKELASAKLEIHYLTDFLEQNSPKLLIGLKQRRSTMLTGRRSTPGSLTNRTSMSTGLPTALDSSRRSMTGTFSMGMGVGPRRGLIEYRLNYKTKADMAEKSAIDVNKQVRLLENEARRKIKRMRAEVEEMRIRGEETEETLKSFMLYFMAEESDLAFLESATEKQLIHKLHKFTCNWIKYARGLMATMRLRNNHLQESCQQFRSELLTKSDLSKVLSAVDFEQIMIKRAELLQDLDEKHIHMSGIKNKTGKASMAMGEEKASMLLMEEKHKQIKKKIVEVVKAIAKLKQECKNIDASNEIDTKELEQMQMQLERYRAPSVVNYIDRKHETSVLEKEEKLLKRKINIMSIRLDNLSKRYKGGH